MGKERFTNLGDGWKAEITLGYADGKRIKKTKSGFSTKKKALEYLSILKNESELTKKITLQSIYEGWEDSYLPKLSSSKQTAYKIAYNKLKSILYIDVRNLHLNDLQKLVNNLSGGYYPKRDVKALLSQLYKRAIIDGALSNNIAQYIELPTLEAPHKDAFKEEEIKCMWDVWNKKEDVFIGFVLIMIYTGMRPGELQNVLKSNINYDERIIIGAGIKTKKGKDSPIVIASQIIPVLKELSNYSKTDRLMPHNDKTLYTKYYAAIEKAGCIGARKLSPHCCRHTTATALALGNVAPAIIKDVMRHTKYETTLGYTHLDTAPLLEAIDKIK